MESVRENRKWFVPLSLHVSRSESKPNCVLLGHHQTTSFTWLGVPKSSLSGLEKFEAPDPAEWCPRGYIVVNVDARGCFDSEGDIFIFGTQEGRDGYDTIEWIAEQSWCDGNVALVGNSWLAIAQW